MTNPTVDGHPAIDVLLGRGASRLSITAAAGLALVACLVVAAVVSSVRMDQTWAFAAFAVVVILIAWWSTLVGSVIVALLGFLFGNGFAVDTAGTLEWHGAADLLRLTVLVGLALTTSLLGRRRLDSAQPGRGAPRGGNRSG